MQVRVAVRALEAADLADLDWSGGAEHVRAVAGLLQAGYEGAAEVLVAELANGRLVGLGAVDYRPSPGAGTLTTLAVHERLQSLGIGRALVAELERRILAGGRRRARILVELDNPRARALYRRLGYAAAGPALDAWPVAGGRTYVAACLVLERALGDVPGAGDRPG